MTQPTAGLTTGHSAARKAAARLQLALLVKYNLTADILCYNETAYRFAPFVKWIRLKAHYTYEGVFIVFIYQYTVP